MNRPYKYELQNEKKLYLHSYIRLRVIRYTTPHYAEDENELIN